MQATSSRRARMARAILSILSDRTGRATDFSYRLFRTILVTSTFLPMLV